MRTNKPSNSLRKNSLNRVLTTETLEQRWTPAGFGVAWSDSTHLTLSFAPDGTSTAGVPSQLISSMDAKLPRATWQNAILQAAQAWSEVANINIGVRNDGGQAFGTPGPNQRDPRFGDFRIGGYAMDPSALAEAVEPNGFVIGSMAGDIFFNTQINWTESTLKAAALHEIGHALGLAHSTDPTSVMFSHLNNNTALSTSDIAAIRALYGTRSIDLNEGTKGNNNTKNATRIRYSQVSGGYNGSTPLVNYGDLGRAGDIDVFYVKPLLGYNGSMSFRLQTTGISLLSPKITITDANGVVLATKTSLVNNGDTLNLRINNVIPDAEYFVTITSASASRVQVGRYALGVTFDGLVQPTAVSLDSVMRGNFEALAPEKVDLYFKNPASLVIDDDLHVNDTTLGAVKLVPGPGQPNARDLSIQSTLTDATDVDFFTVKSPTTNAGLPWVVTISLNAWGPQSTLPRVQLFNANMVQIPTSIVANGNGLFTVQAVSVPQNADLFLRVASPTQSVGNYELNVNFGTKRSETTTFAARATAVAGTSYNYTLYVAQTQLLSLGLESLGAVTLQLRDRNGVLVQQLTARPGELATSISKVLTPGEYRVTVTPVRSLGFTLKGDVITNPIGPVVNSATMDPQYQSTTTPQVYNYPNGTTTKTPYLWLVSPV